MHPKLSLYNRPFLSVTSYREMIDLAAEHSLSYLEAFSDMEFAEPDVEAARELAGYARARNVRFCCLSVFADLVGEEGEATRLRLKDYARVADALGVPFLHHTVAPRFRFPADDSVTQAAFERGVLGVRCVFDFAATLGVRTVFENQGFLFNGVSRFTRFLSEVDREVGVVADFGNVFQADERITPFIEACGERIVHVHLKDMITVSSPDSALSTLSGGFVRECDLGAGEVDFSGALAALSRVGYRGLFSMERHAYGKDVRLVPMLECAAAFLAAAGF